MNGIQKHQLANRTRRIPRRIHQLLTIVRAVQARINTVENDESLSDTVRTNFIRSLRGEVGPANTQIRSLIDRGHELGIPAQLLNA